MTPLSKHWHNNYVLCDSVVTTRLDWRPL